MENLLLRMTIRCTADAPKEKRRRLRGLLHRNWRMACTSRPAIFECGSSLPGLDDARVVNFPIPLLAPAWARFGLATVSSAL